VSHSLLGIQVEDTTTQRTTQRTTTTRVLCEKKESHLK
jgi:hypothetical protein